MPPYTVNPATPSDVPLLLEMIRELAGFEQLAHELEVTEDLLQAALFGSNPVARALVAKSRPPSSAAAIT